MERRASPPVSPRTLSPQPPIRQRILNQPRPHRRPLYTIHTIMERRASPPVSPPHSLSTATDTPKDSQPAPPAPDSPSCTQSCLRRYSLAAACGQKTPPAKPSRDVPSACLSCVPTTP